MNSILQKSVITTIVLVLALTNITQGMYDPKTQRFSSRDPVMGNFKEPLTLHQYLYCNNNPINYVDRDGKFAFVIGGSLSFNSNEASKFATTAMDLADEHFNGYFGKALSAAFGLMSMNTYTALAAQELGGITGGTVGIGGVLGYGREEGLFGGVIGWAAGGIGVGINFTATGDFAVSLNTQNMRDLEGGFIEVGASVAQDVIFGPFLRRTAGLTVSRGIDNDIYLVTGNLGGGVVSGFEMHGYIGHSWIIAEF